MSDLVSAERVHEKPAEDALDLLGISPAGARVLRYFLVRPDARPHARQLQRVLGLGGRSLQRETERMLALGVLERLREGRLVRYSVVEDSRVWRAIRLLASDAMDPTPLLHVALADVPGIQTAFIFGSSADGTQREDSDIDVLVLEDPTLDRKKLLRQIGEVELLLGREVNVVCYTPQSLAQRLGDRRHPAWSFVRNMITGPRRLLVGSLATIAALATAAGMDGVTLVGA
jgi:predicted nucleotidyltransferase